MGLEVGREWTIDVPAPAREPVPEPVEQPRREPAEEPVPA